MVKPFKFDASHTGFAKVKEFIRAEKEHHHMKEVVVGIEATGHYYEDLVWVCKAKGYHVRILNAATTASAVELVQDR